MYSSAAEVLAPYLHDQPDPHLPGPQELESLLHPATIDKRTHVESARDAAYSDTHVAYLVAGML